MIEKLNFVYTQQTLHEQYFSFNLMVGQQLFFISGTIPEVLIGQLIEIEHHKSDFLTTACYDSGSFKQKSNKKHYLRLTNQFCYYIYIYQCLCIRILLLGMFMYDDDMKEIEMRTYDYNYIIYNISLFGSVYKFKTYL